MSKGILGDIHPEDLARRFHELYERLAPEHGYETRAESAVQWDKVPRNNRALMIAVCKELLLEFGPDATSYGAHIY